MVLKFLGLLDNPPDRGSKHVGSCGIMRKVQPQARRMLEHIPYFHLSFHIQVFQWDAQGAQRIKTGTLEISVKHKTHIVLDSTCQNKDGHEDSADTHRWLESASTTKHTCVSQRLLDGRWPPTGKLPVHGKVERKRLMLSAFLSTWQSEICWDDLPPFQLSLTRYGHQHVGKRNWTSWDFT